MAILLVSALIIPPLLITRLGKEGYGVWMLVGQVIAYLAILDLGVSSSIGRFVAKYNAKNDFTNLSCTISSSIFLFLVSSLFMIVTTLIIWPNFSSFFNLSEEYSKIAKWLILLTGVGVAINFPLRIGRGILEGTHRFDQMYFFRASEVFLKLLLIILIFGLLGCKNLLYLALISVVVTILPNFVMCRFAWNKLSNIKLRYKHVRLSSLKEIWSLSLSSLVVTFAALLFGQGQVIAVGKINGSGEVIIYAIPVALLRYGSMLISYIIGAFKPMASHMQALNKTQILRKLNIAGVKVSVTISLFIAVMAIVFSHSFLTIWLPSQALSTQDFRAMADVITVMAIGFAIGVPQNVTGKMLSGADKHWFVAVVSLAASLVGLLVGILLMAKTPLGLYGMALGWATVLVIKGALVFPAAACYYFKIKPSQYIQQAYLPPLAAATILIVTAYVITKNADTTSIAPLLLSIAFCLVVYAIAVYFICFDQRQKKQIWSLIPLLQKKI